MLALQVGGWGSQKGMDRKLGDCCIGMLMTQISRKEQSGKNIALVRLYVAHSKMPQLPGVR